MPPSPRFSTSGFFHESVSSPGPQIFHWGRFEFFRKFVEMFTNECLSPASIRPAINLSPVTMNRWTIIVGDNYTGELLSPVTTTPAINLLPVTRTRMTSRWGAAKDRKKLKRTNQRYLQPSMLDTAADGVIGTAMKSCIHKVEQRPMRPPK